MEWCVEKNGKVWYNKLESEEYCIRCINSCVGEGLGDIDDFTYRPMSLEEVRSECI
jgi:hypothetical protein